MSFLVTTWRCAKDLNVQLNIQVFGTSSFLIHTSIFNKEWRCAKDLNVQLHIQVFGTSSSCNKKRHLEIFVKPKQYEWRMKMSQRSKIPHRFGHKKKLLFSKVSQILCLRWSGTRLRDWLIPATTKVLETKFMLTSLWTH